MHKALNIDAELACSSLSLIKISLGIICMKLNSVVILHKVLSQLDGLLLHCINKGMLYPHKECTMHHLTVNLHPNPEAEALKIMYNATLMTHYFSDIDLTATLLS